VAKVLVIAGQVIEPDGTVRLDGREVPFDEADKIAGVRLERCKDYAVIDGVVCEAAEFVQACPACYEGDDLIDETGCGCHECGHTGRMTMSLWIPLPTLHKLQLD
jgi:hypothetical protein